MPKFSVLSHEKHKILEKQFISVFFFFFFKKVSHYDSTSNSNTFDIIWDHYKWAKSMSNIGF